RLSSSINSYLLYETVKTFFFPSLSAHLSLLGTQPYNCCSQMDREMVSCKSYSLKVVLVHLLIFSFAVLAAAKSEEAMFLSAVKSRSHSDVASKSSDEPVTLRGLTETPHAAAARRSLMLREGTTVSGHDAGTGPHESPIPPIKIP
ncbi:hypothetical protein ACLOJK_000650, partial [Asimina triloba]